MNKNPTNEIGLPDDFDIDVGGHIVDDLGDYLDETSSSPNRPAPVANNQPNPVPTNLSVVSGNKPISKPTPEKPAHKKVPRKQVNMNKKTLEKFAEIVEYVQNYSPQADAAGSEVIEAIVSALYDAKNDMSLGSIPERGRWGTPTAQAFKDALSRSFIEAIVSHESKNASSNKRFG